MSEIREAYELAFSEEFEKIAKIDLSDVEDQMGFYLADKYEDEARDLIARETAKRFAVRHPWLTGIPTLGIAPAISNAKGIDQIVASLARRNPEIRSDIGDIVQARRERAVENAKLQIERDRANQAANAVAASALPLALAASAYAENRNR